MAYIDTEISISVLVDLQKESQYMSPQRKRILEGFVYLGPN